MRLFPGTGEELIKQGSSFDVSGSAQAGYNRVEVAIVVAGMADELPRTAGHGAEDCAERNDVETAGGRDTERAVGGADGPTANLG